MYGSPASSKDLNLSFQPMPLKQGSKDGDRKHHHHHPPPPSQQQQQQLSAGLLRFRSAPTSLMGDLSEDFLPQRSTSPEEDAMFARFVSSDPRDRLGEKPPHPAAPSGAATAQSGSQLIRVMEHESTEAEPQRGGGFSSSPSPQLMYLQLQRQQLPSHRPGPAAAENSYMGASPAATDRNRAENGDTVSGLVRHSSSPAGLFAHLGAEGGYAMMRGMYRPGAGPAGEAASDGGRLKSQISFSSRQSSSSGLMSPISEIGSDRVVGGNAPEDGSRCFIPGMPVASWEDPSLLSDSFAGSSRRARDLIAEAGQNGDARFPAPALSHHFSLPPDASSDVARVLQFQDAVPCKIRAKRGCATHPRSIAERVRRTRISERMRKLQELVPNMDKQTSTADMLDLAVDYIKDLQRRVKRRPTANWTFLQSLSESRASCTCSSRHKAA